MSANTASGSILIVDDDPLFVDATAEYLRAKSFRVDVAGSLVEARGRALREFDWILLDEHLPDGVGPSLATAIDRTRTRVLLVSAAPTLDAAIHAVRGGFTDVLHKPLDFDALAALLGPTPRSSAPPAAAPRAPQELPWHTENEPFLHALSRSLVPVLVTGETGTGKGALARLLHGRSRRRGAFVSLNCAGIPASLFEAELFGVARGAFTGAMPRSGLIESADQGTLFLDEIGEMTQELQAKLLTFLDDGCVRRVGGNTTRRPSIRLIAATNCDLARAVEEGAFRADLYHRLDVARVELPPLRSRPRDLAALLESTVQRLSTRDGRPYLLDEDEVARLMAHAWPGNIRELQNVVERSALGHEGVYIHPSRYLRVPAPEPAMVLPLAPEPSHPPTLAAAEREHIAAALDVCNGNRTRAAAMLGISVATLRRKVAQSAAQGLRRR